MAASSKMRVTQRVPIWLLPHVGALAHGVRQLRGPRGPAARKAVEQYPSGVFWKAALTFDTEAEVIMRQVAEAWGASQYVVWSAALWLVWNDPFAPTAGLARFRHDEEAAVKAGLEAADELRAVNARLIRFPRADERREAIEAAGLLWLFPDMQRAVDPPPALEAIG